jgi:hypothetical protein
MSALTKRTILAAGVIFSAGLFVGVWACVLIIS